MNNMATVIVFLAILITAGTSSAAPDIAAKTSLAGESTSVDNDTYIDENYILMFVTNDGSLGRDLSGFFGYDYGTWYPYSGEPLSIAMNINHAGEYSPLFAAGIWLAGIDSASGELRAAVSEYQSEFVAGPMSGGTYMPDDPSFRVYKLYAESLAANPNSDYLNWPEEQGAPINILGNPIMIGDQMLWSVYNDANPAQHICNMGSTEPLGIEIQQTVWAVSSIKSQGDIFGGTFGNTPASAGKILELDDQAVYIEFKMFNNGGRTFKNMYFGMWADPDLGSASDDLVGCDTLNDLFYCYNSTNTDAQYGTSPPASGFRILKGPLVPSAGDTAAFGMGLVPDHKNLNMTAFIKYVGGADPDAPAEIYNYLKGLYSDGAPYIYNAQTLKYMHSGDPVTALGDLDISPADRVMLGSCGPFDFRPGDSQYVLVKFAAIKYQNNLAAITELKNLLNAPYSIPLDVTEPDNELLPAEFNLRANYPNPFNSCTVIEYSLPSKSPVTIAIYNLLGQKVRTLVKMEQAAGNYSIIWDGMDNIGEQVSSGIYFYRMETDQFTQTRKMILLK
ncbi:MAG: T9SS type A sorting domain-containing protein [Candidatus Zixiibacteriota bacterium]